MRTVTTFAIAALAFTSTAAFADDGARRFTHEGATYVYTSKPDHGRTVIAGRKLPSGERFRLIVAGDRVTGTSGGQPVAFRTAAARGAAGSVQVAAN